MNTGGEKPTFANFTKHHFRKLFTLMLLPYLFIVFVNCVVGNYDTYTNVLKHLLLISNLWPAEIFPGVYWFFGLMLQFYVCYYLFFYKKSGYNIVILNALSLLLLTTLIIYPCDDAVMNYVRHQFIGWILPFSLGILYARHDLQFVFKRNSLNLSAFILCAVLLIASETNGIFWLFGPAISVLAALYLNELMKKLKTANRLLIYIGSISAFLFAVHPVIRHLLATFFGFGEYPGIKTLIYFVVSIISAIAYKWVYTKLFTKPSKNQRV